MRHSFVPSRLLLGALVLASGVLSLSQTHGTWSGLAWVPAAMVPAAVIVVGAVAWLSRRVRGRARREKGARQAR